jgi:aminoglycoside 6'-N-acetyltransferase
MYHGSHVSLCPVSQDDLPLLVSWQNDLAVHSEFNFFGLRNSHRLMENWQEDGLISQHGGTLLVVTHLEEDFIDPEADGQSKRDLAKGEIVGVVSYHKEHYGPNDGSTAYNIGISLHTEHRGKGYGTEAQRLLAQYLLATYPVQRIEATTDITNIPEQRSLTKAGFTREGITRQAQWRNGAYHDLVQYSLLRGE